MTRSIETHYIDGAFRASSGAGTLEVVDSATEETLAHIPAGDPADVDRAVTAARAAFEPWSRTSLAERSEALERLAKALESRLPDMAHQIAREVGSPIGMAKTVQTALPIAVVRSFAALLENFPFEEEVGNSRVVREPAGVAAAITPWNYPLHQIIGKIAPALAAGCTVVLKPSEIAPLNAYLLAELIDESDLFPAGVFNLVSGTGPEVGAALAAHPQIDMVSFTGSTRAGVEVARAAAPTVKRVTQELGGKSANVLLDDADLERAVRTGVRNCYLNSGQTCSAWTRMLVPRARHDEAAELAAQLAQGMKVGDPETPGVRLGPLVSAAQRERVRGYIREGVREGATLMTGGVEPPEGLEERGFFVRPTVFSGVESGMRIAREEIFGPVLSILPHDGDDHAVEIANDSTYGLAGGVWSQDEERAVAVARRLRTGQVDINGGRYNPLAPFGGYKQSGNGRELGRFGLEEYLEIKSLQL
ncbi:MAG: aldehyde dehydrogenase family protein [Acidobacteriota bacterium]